MIKRYSSKPIYLPHFNPLSQYLELDVIHREGEQWQSCIRGNLFDNIVQKTKQRLGWTFVQPPFTICSFQFQLYHKGSNWCSNFIVPLLSIDFTILWSYEERQVYFSLFFGGHEIFGPLMFGSASFQLFK